MRRRIDARSNSKLKIWSVFFLSFALLSCRSKESGDLDFSTQFQNLQNWRVVSTSESPVVEIFADRFFESEAEPGLPDLLVLTESGGRRYPNLINSSSNAWGSAQLIPALGGAPILAAETIEDVERSKSAIVLARSSAELSVYRFSGASYQLQSSFNLNSSQVRELQISSEGANILLGGSDGSYQILNLLPNFNITPNSALVGAGLGPVVELLSADLNSSGRSDFVLVGAQQVELVRSVAPNSFAVVDSEFARDLSREIISARLVDLSGTGRKDLVLATSAGFEYYRNISGSGSLQFEKRPISLFPSVVDAQEFEVLDFTGDGIADLVILSSSRGPLFYGGTGSLSFVDVSTVVFAGAELQSLFGPGTNPRDATKLAVADVDGNLSPDLLISNQRGDLVVFFNLKEDVFLLDE